MNKHLSVFILIFIVAFCLVGFAVEAATSLLPFDATWSLEEVKLLVSKGAKVNESDKNGITPIMSASKNCSEVDIIRYLIEQGAEVNKTDKNKWSALMYAIRYNSNTDIENLLLSKGATPTGMIGNMSILEYSLNKLSPNYATIQALIDAGAGEIRYGKGFYYEVTCGVILAREMVGEYPEDEPTKTLADDNPDQIDGLMVIPEIIGKTTIRYIFDLTNMEHDHNTKEIQIPRSVKRVFPQGLSSLHILSSFRISENNPYLSSDGRAIYNKDFTVLYYDMPTAAEEYSVREGVVAIEDSAIRFTEIQDLKYKVVIPASVERINANAFNEIEIQEFSVDPKNQYLYSHNGILFNKDRTSLIKYPTGQYGKVYIVPESVMTIGDYAFIDIKDEFLLIIQQKDTSISKKAFNGISGNKNIAIGAFDNSSSKRFAKSEDMEFFACYNKEDLIMLALEKITPTEDVTSIIDAFNEGVNYKYLNGWYGTKYGGYSFLEMALAVKSFKLIEYLISTGVFSVELKTIATTPPLLLKAIGWGCDSEIIELITQNGAQINTVDSWLRKNQNSNILLYALQKGAHPAVAIELIEREDIKAADNWKNPGMEKCLLYAVRYKEYPEIINTLINRGYDVNIRSDRGDTPLIIAVRDFGTELSSEDIGIVDELLAAGAKVNAVNVWGETPLSVAIENSNKQVVELLINNGANIRQLSESQESLLHLLIDRVVYDYSEAAVDYFGYLKRLKEYSEIMKILLISGIDPNAINPITKKAPIEEIVSATRKNCKDFVSLLVTYNVKIPINSSGRADVLEEAILNDYPPEVVTLLVSALIRTRSELDVKEALDWGLLLAASYCQYPQVINALIEVGADANTLWYAGKIKDLTLLMMAARSSKQPSVISALINAGVNAKLKSSEGKRAIDYAADNPYLKGTDAYWSLNDVSY